MSNWSVVRTKFRKELSAALNLQKQGYHIYCPKYLKRTTHARKTKYVAAPLFPNYLFIKIDPDFQRWRSILSTIDVEELLCHGDRPAKVPDTVIEDIKHRENDKGLVELLPWAEWQPGQKLRVVAGAFVDKVGILQDLPDVDRVRLLLDILGAGIAVSVPRKIVTACT
jgi:transcriptional antiterminator RfaH